MKRFLKGTIVTLSFVMGLSVVSVPLAYGFKEKNVVYKDRNMTEEISHIKTNYSVNKNGQTYGILSDSVYIEDNPRLVAVIGDNGREGYVYFEEFIAGPETREEARKMREDLEAGRYVPKSINVYEADGKTVIDTFTETIPDAYADKYK